MKAIRHSGFWSMLVVLLVAIPQARAQEVAPTTQPDKFTRYIDRGDAGGELDTADVTFQNKAGAVVHLVAAVHIGEQSYYEELNKSFAGYDAVLYELVTSKVDAGPPQPGQTSDNFISQFQHLLKNVLNLQFQLDVIDYTRPNFVHADLDMATFEKMQSERGESFTQMMMKQIMNAWTNPPAAAEQSTDEEVRDLVRLVCRPDSQTQFKRLLAKQMDAMDASAMGLDGPDGSVIITERNKAAFAVLDKTLATGKTRVAIFYGAAHMPDMSTRLVALGFNPIGVQWHKAWDLTVRPNAPSAIERLFNSSIDAAENLNLGNN